MKNVYIKGINKFYFCFSAFSTIICFIMHINNSPTNNVSYFIIPLAYFINFALIRRYSIYANQISVLIIDMLMLIRYTLLPLSYYFSLNTVQSFYYDNIYYSMILMIYEIVTVTIVLNILCRKILNIGVRNKINENNKLDRNNIKLGIIIIAILFFLTLLKYPQYVRNIFTFKFEDLSEVEVESGINGMYNLIFKTGLIVISCLLMTYFSNIKKKKTYIYFLSIISSWVCIWISSLGTSGSISRTSFLTNGIIYTVIILKIYPNRKKETLTLSSVVIILMLILGTLSRFYSDLAITSSIQSVLSYEVLDSYFSGLRNVSVGLEMSKNFSDQIGIGTFINDVFAGLPYIASRIGMNFDNRIVYFFNNAFFGRVGNTSRICPMLIQSGEYFSYLLSPILSCFCVVCAIYANKFLLFSKSTLGLYFWALTLYYFAAYSMFNLNIIMGGIWNKLLPLAIILILNKIKVKNGKFIYCRGSV